MNLYNVLCLVNVNHGWIVFFFMECTLKLNPSDLNIHESFQNIRKTSAHMLLLIYEKR